MKTTKPTTKTSKKPVKTGAVKVRRNENSKAERVRFYSLVALLILSIVLAWFVSSGVSQTLADQFS